ncbi:hypothetical protein LTS12_027401, partial [Elasticomyces elasticus]
MPLLTRRYQASYRRHLAATHHVCKAPPAGARRETFFVFGFQVVYTKQYHESSFPMCGHSISSADHVQRPPAWSEWLLAIYWHMTEEMKKNKAYTR